MLGDSIVNHIRGYELSQRVENCNVVVKNFSGAKVRCMEDYPAGIYLLKVNNRSTRTKV